MSRPAPRPPLTAAFLLLLFCGTGCQEREDGYNNPGPEPSEEMKQELDEMFPGMES